MFDILDWVVVPGGPGLSVKYLESGFADSFSRYRLYFYNSLGSPGTEIDHIPTIMELVNQLFDVVELNRLRKFGLITHSFGNYLAMRALERAGNNISAIIMISPMPFVFSHWKNALLQIEKNIPEMVLKRIQMLACDQTKGIEVFELIFPYYTSRFIENVPRIPFNLEVCDKISAQVDEYNDVAFLSSFNIPWVCIVGDKDPFFVERDLLADRTIIIPDVGHYPFFEDPIAFTKAISDIEGK